ncbi:MAG: hypothetical protein KatS3mg027_1138 [Bacteroidia bacterium]|nr:MAG: hypothetical protein KatS3mg027_1138 [Bacteroidia bacterium]
MSLVRKLLTLCSTVIIFFQTFSQDSITNNKLIMHREIISTIGFISMNNIKINKIFALKKQLII